MAKKKAKEPPVPMITGPQSHPLDDPFEKGKRIAEEMGIDFEHGRFDDGPKLPDPKQVLADERRGAEKAKQNRRIPKNGHKCLEKYGFAFGEEVDGLYVEVTTWPEGFTHELMQDPRGFYIKDPSGEKVASGFIKETSYDRYADIRPCKDF